ncbi:hypothetical protein [Pseudomonas arcuscaelestis]|uniref:hypothetical protein n=1 Tax=Pseudomonas arcuscaelestis TaxID=2710591 RepID=UPI001F447E33|nr:hypothetical protein [Pseudomonas arcuscaelestis]
MHYAFVDRGDTSSDYKEGVRLSVRDLHRFAIDDPVSSWSDSHGVGRKTLYRCNLCDAKQGIELLQKRRATWAELGPAWPESATDVLAQAVELLGQIADLKQRLSTTYSDAIESLDIDLLLSEWKEAEESFWPKSWFGKRRISALLASAQITAGEVDHGKDLATWAEIRSLRRAIDELEPGHECVAVWQGSKSEAEQLSTAIKLQEAIRLQKADSNWVDEGLHLVEQGQLGEALKEELQRLSAL